MSISYNQSLPKRLNPETGRFRCELDLHTVLGADQLADLLGRPLMTMVHQVDGLHAEGAMEMHDLD